jgi:hypothetical protein
MPALRMPGSAGDPSEAERVETHTRTVAAALAAILLVQWLAAFRLAGELRLDPDVFFLLPVALACVYGIAAILGGQRLGLFAAALWALAPFAAVPLFDERYREIYKDGFLSQAVGLGAASGFRAAVALLVAAFFAARAMRVGGGLAGALAGAATAVACALDSSATLFAPAAVLALAVARRWLALAPLTLGVAVGLAIAGLPPAPDDWGNLGANEEELREFFWSVRLLEWLPLAGVLGVARRSPALAALLGLWFGAYLVARGTDPGFTIGRGTFLPALLPAFPAYVLLVAAIPLLVPPLPSLRDATPRRLRARRSRALAPTVDAGAPRRRA